MITYEVNGFYGSGNTPCQVLVCENNHGKWYCVEDSVNVNFTYDSIELGVDVETLYDTDFFTASKNIETLEDLENEVLS